MALINFYKGKKIVLFGGASFVAKYVIEHLIVSEIDELVIIDSSEDGVFWLNNKYSHIDFFHGYCADVTKIDEISGLLADFDIAIYLAAKKHVGLSEQSALAALNTNAACLQPLLDFCHGRKCSQFLYVSSDKAVKPTNVMGATKLIGERTVCFNRSSMVCSVVRFGNVIGSPGSLIHVLRACKHDGLIFKLRGDLLTRFFMTPYEAGRLVLASAKLARGGEVFVMKMPSARVLDFVNAYQIFADCAIEVEVSKLGLGEKTCEHLLSQEESQLTRQLDDFLLVDQFNQFPDLDIADPKKINYSSDNDTVSVDALVKLMIASEGDECVLK